jgi:hypothetical protein
MAAPSTHSKACDVALALAGLGLYVFPCCWPDAAGRCACPRGHTNPKDVGKAPLTAHGFKDATRDPATIESWWAEWPEANVAIDLARSGLVMIDPDSPAAETDVRERGMGATQVRHSRNRAYLCRRTSDCPTISATRLGASGELDLKADGYAVVYGRHREGQDIYLEDFEPADVPAWVTELLQAVARHRDDRTATLTPDPDAAAKGEALYPTIRRRLPERIQRTIEEGPDAYTAAPESGNVVRLRPPDLSRSGADGSVVYYLVGLGLSDDDIRNLYEALPVGTHGKYAERGEPYLRTTIGNQRAFYEKTGTRRTTSRPSTNGHSDTTPPPPNGRDHGDEGGDEPPGLPDVNAKEEDLTVIGPQVWRAVQAANAIAPRLFQRSGELARIGQDDESHPMIQTLTPARLRHELTRVVHFVKPVKNVGWVVTHAPPVLLEELAATAPLPVPVLTRVTTAPTFAPDGSLPSAPGYHPGARVYYAPPAELVVPPIPPVPTSNDVEEAKRWLLAELLADFPFAGEADRAHAVALGLAPFVRDLVAGPTPMHLVEAPEVGTGKTLLVTSVLTAGCGSTIFPLTYTRDDDEMRKRLTTLLLGGRAAALFDNVRDPIDSSNLSAVLTAWPTHGDRLLGSNQEARLSVRCVWAATANNPSVSTEIARRSVRIRLDAKQDRPFEREGFRHPNLTEWVAEHRGALIWANCVLVRHWWAQGRQDFSGRRLGSFESWTRVVGGILEAAEIPGFLTNLAAFYEEADWEGAIWRAFVAAWWEKHQTSEVGAADLFSIALETEGFDLGGGSEKAQRTVFGKALGRQKDRVIGGYVITKVREAQRLARWRLLPTDGSGRLI